MGGVGQLERMRWTTNRYARLQGLGLAVVGAVLTVNATLASIGAYSPSVSVLLWGLGLIGAVAAHRYYRRSFGRVTPTSASVDRGLREALSWLALLVVMLGVPAVTGWSTGPFLIGGGIVVTAWAWLDRRRSGWVPPSTVVAGVFLLGLGALVAAGAPVGSWLDDRGVSWFGFAGGGALIVAGLLDHVALMRGLRVAAGRAATR